MAGCRRCALRRVVAVRRGAAGAGAGGWGRWRRGLRRLAVDLLVLPVARAGQHASDLVLDGLQVGLLVRVDACVAGHPEKRLTGTLRVHDLLALTDDAESTLCGSLVGLSLTVGDILERF